MAALTIATIARELGVTRPRASQMAAAGMPTHSIAAARAWREENVRPRIERKGDGARKKPDAHLHDIHEARAKREFHEAQIAEMRARQLAGSLVEADAVQRAVVDAAAQIRLAIERIPDKIAERLAAEASPEGCHVLLSAELDAVLDELSALKLIPR